MSRKKKKTGYSPVFHFLFEPFLGWEIPNSMRSFLVLLSSQSSSQRLL